MARPQIDFRAFYRLMALNYPKKKIKKELEVGEATYWRYKARYEALSDAERNKIKELATQEERAKERFEDYEEVKKWVARMRADRVKTWKKSFNQCRRVWLILQKKNPENWTTEDIKIRVIPELRKRMGSVFAYLVAIRSLRPDLKEEIKTKREKLEPSFEWKRIYDRMMQQKKLETFLRAGGFKPELVKRVHKTLGCREGSKGIGGILGLEWDKVNWEKKTIDVYEGKTGGGFYWLDCPLDLFGDRTYEMLRQYWIEQGKPTTGKIFHDIEYHDHSNGTEKLTLTGIYKMSAQAIDEKYGRGGITPHFADKLHASLLIDADVPLEMVAGDKPYGIMGRGWEDLSTLKKYYLAFRKAKIEENRNKARAMNFSG